MMISDLLFCMILPLESILEFLNQSEDASKIIKEDSLLKTNEDYVHSNINFFMILRQNSLSHFITEAINALIGIVVVLTIYMFFRFDPAISKIKSNEKSIYGLTSFMILLLGRFLSNYFSVFQIITIRCGFKSLNCET